ncbi:MAG: hypothetical protein AB8H86_27000 [Polyangiales bacterium]
MIVLLLIPLAAALLAMPIVRRAPIHGALLAGWAAMTFLGFAPGGLMASAMFFDSSPFGALLIALVSLGGFSVSFMMVARLSRLYRGEPLGCSRFLVAHHAAVVVAFFVAELIAGNGFYMTLFCLVACGIGGLIVGYQGSMPYLRPDRPRSPRVSVPQPVAF